MSTGEYLDGHIDRAMDLLEQARVMLNGHMVNVSVRSLSVHSGGPRSMPKVTVTGITDGGQTFTLSLS
jgi:hypothetical protein